LNLQQKVSDHLFFGHLRIIVIGESIARKGIEGISSYFRRDAEVLRLA